MTTEMSSRRDETPQFGSNHARVVFALALVAFAVVLLTVPTHVDTPIPVVARDRLASTKLAPSRSAPIVFVRRDEGGFEKSMQHLYLMAPDGLGQRRIEREVQGWDAAWAPDGNRLAFTCPVNGNLEICVMNADGSDLARLTLNPATDEHPAWSPDGSRILFASNRDGRFQIYAMGANGLGPFALTHTATNEREPAWSPDGKHIAFTSERVNHDAVLMARDIFVMNPDGSGQTSLTRSATACISESPAWSPDSAQIAFSSNCDAPSFQIYTMQADGSAQRRLTTGEAQDRHPAWSPDGVQIVFDSTRDLADSGTRMLKDAPQIYVMNADGSAVKRLTNAVPEFSSHPAWNWELDNRVRIH